MTITRDRMQTLGWGTTLAVCFALTAGLSFQVNAVKSKVALTERQIVKLRHENQRLRNEFAAEANFDHLKTLNALEYGQHAPEAGQFITTERQVALLGKPRGIDAPAPIRMASADGAEVAGNNSPMTLVAMVSPVSRGQGDVAGEAAPHHAAASERTGHHDRLAHTAAHVADRATDHTSDHAKPRRIARESSIDDILGRIDRHRSVRE